jgi:electron transfer flavoprotein alpha subunit
VTTSPVSGTGPESGSGPVTALPGLGALAVVLARSGELPPDAAEVITEAGGHVLVIGDGAADAAAAAPATRAWCCDTGPGLQPGQLARRLGPLVAHIPLLVLPGTADGRDLAPRLAAGLGRPLLANACRAVAAATGVRAELCRLDDRIVIPAEADGPAVVTLAPGTGTIGAFGPPADVVPVARPDPDGDAPDGDAPDGDTPDRAAADVTVLDVLEPDPSTMDLAEAPLVFGGGAGLAAGLDLPAARAAFGLLAAVAAALGASAGATRVATDAGWIAPDRQIGTTGVTIRPHLYVAFGVSGATQHTSGLGAPDHIVSVNLDAHCPMTAMSSLGLVADARGTLTGLAGRLGVEVPAELRDAR